MNLFSTFLFDITVSLVIAYILDIFIFKFSGTITLQTRMLYYYAIIALHLFAYTTMSFLRTIN